MRLKKHFLAFAALAALLLAPLSLWANEIRHKDGRLIEGKFVPLSKMAEDPGFDNPEISKPILMCDDDLTRLFVPKKLLLDNTFQISGQRIEGIEVKQIVSDGKDRVACAGPLLNVEPFDIYGRRTVTVGMSSGAVPIIQGITKITPHWTRVEGLKAGKNISWDMRIATSSIPRETLSAIVRKAINNNDLNKRLSLVKLFMRAERYRDAEQEIQAIMQDFPDNPLSKEALETVHQLGAKVLLKEIELRRNAGQFQLAKKYLSQFPTQGILGMQQEIRQTLTDLEQKERDQQDILTSLDAFIAKLTDDTAREEWQPFITELKQDLSPNTLDRMAAYQAARGDVNLTPEQKLALALSGWLLSSDRALAAPKSALSLLQTRGLVRDYLQEPVKLKRDQLRAQIQSQEANSPDLLTRLMSKMKPVLHPVTQKPAVNGAGDLNSDTTNTADPILQQKVIDIEVTAPAGMANYHYQILLPLEYDPYRTYPAIVALHAQGMKPSQELDWWAGSESPSGRLGQATRHGYFVIAPVYAEAHLASYQQGTSEQHAEQHDRVMRCLRDALRRYSIDSDRVFLSGHSMGGDAAWDIALSHPDTWAGVIPINALVTKESGFFYWQNAANVPFYFVRGELDCGTLKENSVSWDKYMSAGYDVTIVEYLGRGHEHFSDEIQRLFDWMNRKNRVKDLRVAPKKVAVKSRRSTDCYFWSLEVQEFNVQNLEKGIVLNIEQIENLLKFSVPTQSQCKFYLGPDQVDFSANPRMMVNGKELGPKTLQPSTETLLEDVRTRADRQHPFWAVVEKK